MRRGRERNSGYGSHDRARRNSYRNGTVRHYNRDIRETFGGEKAGGTPAGKVLRHLRENRSPHGYRNRSESRQSNDAYTLPERDRRDYHPEDFMEEDTRRYRSTDYNADMDEFGFLYDNGYDDEDEEDYRDFSFEDLDEDPYSEREEWGRDERRHRKRHDHSHLRNIRFL